jgi:hypothetical protein
MEPQIQKLPSGKSILRQFADDGAITQETHSYGLLDIAIQLYFKDGAKVEEIYFANRRMVSCRTYEKARVGYPDMPAADLKLEDVSGGLLTDIRREQRRKKAEAEKRLAASAESRFPRPVGTNWLRIISADRAHLVEFASRDWKALAREKSLPTGQSWLSLFGFHGPPGGSSLAEGLIVGYETLGRREEMLQASRNLLDEVRNFVPATRDPTWCTFSVRKKPKPRKPKPLSWERLLPKIIEFLEGLSAPTVTIYNHHR